MPKMKTRSSRQEKMRPAGKIQGKNNQISHNCTTKANSTDTLGETHSTT
jgi:ribosomal protein L35